MPLKIIQTGLGQIQARHGFNGSNGNLPVTIYDPTNGQGNQETLGIEYADPAL